MGTGVCEAYLLRMWCCRTRRALVVAVVATLVSALVAGCSSSRKNGAAAPPTPSAWQHILEQIEPDGTVTLPTALSAFALAIGPVPGASAVAGPSETI